MRLEGVQLGTAYPVGQKVDGQKVQNKIVEKDKTMKKGEEGVGEILPGERVIPEEQLIHAVDRANKSFEPFDRRFEISIHEKTGSIMVKVINSINDEVIREIPPEKILDMVAHMLEIAGIIVDERV